MQPSSAAPQPATDPANIGGIYWPRDIIFPVQESPYGKFVSQISGSFIDLPVEGIAAEIDRTMAALLEVFDTDRAIFYELDAAGGPPLSIQQAVRPPAPRYVGMPSSLRWYLAELRAGRTVALARAPEQIPTEATAAERDEVANTGLLSIMAVPLHIGCKLACVLSTSSFRRYRSWSSGDEEQLKVVGNVIANALYRKRTQTELQGRLAENEALKSRLQA